MNQLIAAPLWTAPCRRGRRFRPDGYEQDADVAEKMPFIQSNQPPTLDEIDTMIDWAFAPGHRELWNRVSRPGRIADRRWNDDRLKALQQSVEQRAIWLYRRFYDDLGYMAWHASQHDGGR